jgi:hypothetical protein
MAKYIISIGSNLANGDSEVTAAMEWLANVATLTAATRPYHTADAKNPQAPGYTNAIAIVMSELRHGVAEVVIDLDLVCCDNTILRPRDYAAPYFVEGIYLLTSKL